MDINRADTDLTFAIAYGITENSRQAHEPSMRIPYNRERSVDVRAHPSKGAALASPAHTLFVDAGDMRIPVAVTRKRVRNLNLRIHGDGSVALSIPVRTSVATAQKFLDRKAAWIAERVRRRQKADELPRTAEDLQIVPLWGELAPLADALCHAGIRFGSAARPSTFGAAQQVETEELATLSPDEYNDLVAKLYRSELDRVLPEVVANAENVTGMHASRWSLRRMKSRWGSCTPKTRAIRINTNLAAYPRICLNMVVIHELVHLMEPSHNARFHMLLDTYCPNNREASALLKHGAREIATDRM